MNIEYTNGNETAFRTKKTGQDRREHSEDFMMPDYIPDIRRIAFSGVETYIEKKAAMSDRVEWECYLTYTAVLLGEDDSLRSITLRSSIGGEIKGDFDGDDLWLDVRVEDSAMRALDPRRINGRCRICVTAYSRCAVRTAPNMSALDGGDSAFCKKNAPISYTTVKRMTVADRRASHDVELDSSMPEIADIVYCRVNPIINTVTVKDGRCELRGAAAVDLCYCDPDGRYNTHNAKVPISDGFDFANEGCRNAMARATAGEIRAEVRNNAYAENKVVELDFGWNADVAFAVDGECEAVDDIYSTVYDLELREKDIELERCCGAFCGSFSVSGEESCSELMIDPIENVVCCRPEIKLNEVRRTDGGRLRFGGNLKIAAVCSCNSAKEGLSLCEINIPFKYERELAVSSDDFEAVSDVRVSSVKIRSDGSKLRADCEVSISALVTEPVSGRGIVECKVKEELDIRRAPMTLCFKKSDDTLWDIAKRYNVGSAELLERNGIDESEFDSKRVIVIPPPAKR